MLIDKPEHKDALLQLIEQASFPGAAVDFVYELKQAIRSAEVRSPDNSRDEEAEAPGNS